MVKMTEHFWLDCDDLATFAKREIANFHPIFAASQITPHTVSRGKNKRHLLAGSQVRQVLASVGIHFQRKPQCLSMMMCKGGVGKTTIGFFLGLRLASYGANVLFIDTDPQANLTAALRPDLANFRLSETTPVILDVLSGRCTLRQAILKLSPQMHLLPSTALNSLLEKHLSKSARSPVRDLSEILRSVEGEYDYIIIDCAPSLNIINASVIYASDMVLMPFQLDEFSRLGIAQSVSEINDLEREFGFKTSIRLLLNKFQANEKLTMMYLGDVVDRYRDTLLQVTIRQNAQIKSALAFRNDIFNRSNSKPGADFDELAQSILAQTMIGLRNA